MKKDEPKYYIKGPCRIHIFAEFTDGGEALETRKIVLNKTQERLVQDFLETLRRADPFMVSNVKYTIDEMMEDDYEV